MRTAHRKGKSTASRVGRKTEKEEDEELNKEAEAQDDGPFVFTESPACPSFHPPATRSTTDTL